MPREGRHLDGVCSGLWQGPAATHIQVPQQQLYLIPILEVRAVFLVQVRVHLAKQLLSILHVFVVLGETQGYRHRWKATTSILTSGCGFMLMP